ncbi:MAG: hypothetical protein IKR53_04350, partial [Clostridia bacterium]|nr:hypothetical protein [Clostridia bacterium]
RYDEYGDFNEDKGSDYSDARARIAKQKHYDDLKVQYCKKNGIALEFIKYTESSYSELEKQITDILESYGIDGESGFIPF